MTLREQRDNILRIFAASLDSCIAQAEEHGNPQPIRFETETRIRFDGTDELIGSRPALDFTKPIGPQFENKSVVV